MINIHSLLRMHCSHLIAEIVC